MTTNQQSSQEPAEPTETPEQGTPATSEETDLGDAGKKAIAAERKARTAAERELALLRKQAKEREDAELSELERFRRDNERLTQELASSTLDSTRRQVALEKGIPADLVSRLQGNDYESLSADADALASLIPPTTPGQVRPDPSQGPKPNTTALSPRDQFAQLMKQT